jgi:hypothetical protein
MVRMAAAWSDLTTLMPFGNRRGPAVRAEVLVTTSTGWGTVWPYRFKDAATLLEDFWAEVDGVLREKGVI